MKKNLSGFTLIEIIVVIVILGVIASVGIPKFFGTFERTKSAEAKQILLSLLNAQKIYKIENGSYTNLLSNLDIEISIATNPNFQTIKLNTSNPIATIDRKGGLYTLKIDDDGTFTCSGGSCSKIGY